MNCQLLAQQIERLMPDAKVRDVARLCLLLVNHVSDPTVLADETKLGEAWRTVMLRMQGASEQHAAMVEDLERIAIDQPDKLSPEQIWTLIRALRVQGQILNLYLGDMACNA